MKHLHIAAASLIAGLVLSTFAATATAFPIPERLEFELSYTGITAGRAVQEVKLVDNGIHIVSTARSADWLRFIFPVDDRIESFLTSETPAQFIGTPRLYQERKHEGKTITNREARFDRQKLEVTTIDHRNKNEKKHVITKRTYDTLSSFFYFRTVPLQVGTSYYIDIFDCKRLWNTEVKVLRREELTTPLGRFKTIVIQPLLKSEGIFARTGEMFIWLTDDDRRIPVQMKSKVIVGSITATLTGGSYWSARPVN
ncbi:MAG: DUF3108 domain-containing protein [Desulfuromonadaceae bacterium]|nr:DUF3108 domain-containing protein [Desulfuromonadaceae bacterium]